MTKYYYFLLANDGTLSIATAIPDMSETLEVMESDGLDLSDIEPFLNETNIDYGTIWASPYVLVNLEVTIYQVCAGDICMEESWIELGMYASPRYR